MTTKISRAEAKALGLKRYFTGEPCKNGHVAEKDTSGGGCVECRRERKKTKVEQRRIAEGREKRYKPKDEEDRRRHLAEYKREWFEKNKESQLSRITAWAKENRDRVRENKARYRRANQVIGRVHVVKRRAAQMDRTPSWADHEMIKFFYATREYMTKETGQEWHVDHIVPLRGKNVCGLHNQFNLQVVPAQFNMKKGNRFEE